MTTEASQVTSSLKKLFTTAYNVYVDTQSKECEAMISVDEFRGEITEKMYQDGIQFIMVDYWDNLPFKYVFEYKSKLFR
jgi:hypothetical protein